MSYAITEAQVRQLASRATDAPALAKAINDAATKFGIDQSLRRLRYFVAQSLFETGYYTKWTEDLTYTTAARLAAVWPSRFTLDPAVAAKGVKRMAAEYLNNPRKVAEYAYGGRNGNRTEGTGDGFDFRGRGAFHLTFVDNYRAYGKDVYGEPDRFLKNPDSVALPADAMMSAGHFWSTRGLNALADSDSYTKLTGVINGSEATAPERMPVLNLCNSVIK